MLQRFIILGMLLATTTCVWSKEPFSLKFELIHADKTIEWGRAVVGEQQRTWSKGLQRSYLRLRCSQEESGKTGKFLSTTNHFSGLRVTHQLVGDRVELTVERNIVKPRLKEIRALARNECKDLSPVVTRTTRNYSFPAVEGASESYPFGEDMVIRLTLQSVVN